MRSKNHINVNTYNKKYYKDILKIIDIVGREYIPPITKRTSIKNYFCYLKGENLEHMKKWINPNIHLPEKGDILVLEYKKKVIGFGAYWNYVDHYDSAYLISLMIYKNFREKGLGSLLVRNIIKNLTISNVKEVTATTWSTNMASKKALIKNGFEIVRTVKDERAKGIDGLYFKKILNKNLQTDISVNR